MVVTTANIEGGAHLTVAELFSGGFQGWSQAAWLLHRMQVPVSVQWGVEYSPNCVRMQTYQRDLTVVTYPEQLASAMEETGQDLTVHANIEDNWWIRTFAVRPVKLAAISAPCQPWSRAAHAAGLHCPEGRLLLRAADVCGAVEVPVVVLEQVEGFVHHDHFPRVLRAWEQSGYEVLWQQTLDAQHVLPATRRRHILIMKHRTCPHGLHLPVIDWSCCRPPTLRTAQAVLELPPDVEQALVPSARVLDMYLDPFYLPSGAGQGHQVLAPFRYRVKTPDCSIGCILAQYGFQHLLPPDLLARKGLLGFFLQTNQHIRFFSGVEIAIMLGAVQPVFLDDDLKSQFMALGNAITIPHAAIGLLLAAAALGHPGLPKPEEVLAAFRKYRMRRDNTLFVPTGPHWLLCPREALQEVLSRLAKFAPAGPPIAMTRFFVPLTMQARDASVTIQVASSLTTEGVLTFCGKSEHLTDIPKEWGTSIRGMTIQVGVLPQLDAFGSFRGGRQIPGIVPGNAFIMDSSQVLQIVDSFPASPQCVLALYTLQGQRLSKWDPHHHCVVASMEHPDQCMFPISFWAGLRPRISVTEGAVEMQVPRAAEAAPAWLGMPFTSLLAAGWGTQVVGFPPQDGQQVTFRHQPIVGTLQLALGQVRELHRFWPLVAELENLRQPAASGGIAVEIHVEAQCIWRGLLPTNLTMFALQDFWCQASIACDLPGSGCISSGSFPCPPYLLLGQVPQARNQCSTRTSSRVVLAIQPQEIASGALSSAEMRPRPCSPETQECDQSLSLTTVTSDAQPGDGEGTSQVISTLTRARQPLPGSAHPDPNPSALARVDHFVQALQAASANQPTPSLEVEVQVVTTRVWQGNLPMHMQLLDIENLWRQASQACILPADCRIFSGPFPCPCNATVGEVQAQQSPRVLIKRGRLVLTVHPATVGGGVKVENGEWTGSRVASLCLSRGCPLASTTAFVDRILAVAGFSKVMAIVASGPEGKRWDALTALANQVEVPMPAPTNGIAKAADRAQKGAQRKKHQNDRAIHAHEVKVEHGFFSNEDGAPCTILEQVTPGATGLVLANLQEATSLCSTLEGIQPDELAVLVLGHQCPDSHSCDGAISFPAQIVATDSKVLLAGCLHNFGDRKVKCQHTTRGRA